MRRIDVVLPDVKGLDWRVSEFLPHILQTSLDGEVASVRSICETEKAIDSWKIHIKIRKSGARSTPSRETCVKVDNSAPVVVTLSWQIDLPHTIVQPSTAQSSYLRDQYSLTRSCRQHRYRK